jgi:hypothetical protein
VMRCPPRHESGMGAITLVPVALVVQPQACVTHKRPLTNRIRRHFARIKAVGLDCGRSWLPRQKEACETSNRRSGDVKQTLGRRQTDARETSNRRSGDVKQTLGTRRRQCPVHSQMKVQDISQTKVRKRRARRPGRSYRPPFHCRLPHGCANDAPCPPRSPARRCDRPSGRSAPRG